jgi:sugar lactone lactonase YvrE
VIVSLGGWREQGIQIVNVKTGKVEQTLTQDSAFMGLVFSMDGRTLYASGGNEDCIYCYEWDGHSARLRTRLILAQKQPAKLGSRYPAGLAVSRDGRFLYAAENISDTLAIVELATGNVIQRIATPHYPYAIAVSPDNTVYVSAWGANSVAMFKRAVGGRLSLGGTITVGRHPSALMLDRSAAKLFVTLGSVDETVVIDTKARKVICRLSSAAPAGIREGVTPNALGLSPGESRLFVAEADSNAVAVFNVSRIRETKQPQQPIGRIPTDWYPTGVLVDHERLLTLCAKGHGSTANLNGPRADRPVEDPGGYTLGQLNGTLLSFAPVSQLTRQRLLQFTKRVSAANHWQIERKRRRYPPFKHVVYIIKENRTYDQVFGDMREGDGDPNLLFFGNDCTPNHRALAQRFGLFDRFFANAEVSSQGHLWSTAGYVTDYSEKTIPSLYADKRADIDEGETDEPVSGFLWQAAEKSNITFRDYGEWVNPPTPDKVTSPARPDLKAHVCAAYPPFDLDGSTPRRRLDS